VIYPLDTSAAIAVLRSRPAQVRNRLRRAMARGATIAISSRALYELWHGVERSARRTENAERVRAFLTGNVQVIGFDEEDAAIAGRIRATSETAGQLIGPCDLLTAAQASRRGATLVTANAGEFARVQGLSWKDWSNTTI
jgi:tRNA(fMet)-specific endonuclease VapC